MRLDQLSAQYSPSCIVDSVKFWAENFPDERAFVFLKDGEDLSTELSFRELFDQSRRYAASLINRGFSGERALLLFPPGKDFIIAFFGCLQAGVTAVPAFPPRKNRNQMRIQAIANDCNAKVALTTSPLLPRAKETMESTGEGTPFDWFSDEDVTASEQETRAVPSDVNSDEVAFLQYTSGSTGSPKGVMLTHGNIIENCSMITEAFEAGRGDVGMSWLPTYHDMGLISGVLNTVFCGCPSFLMSPMLFLQRPIRWLKAISKYKITISGGPNFAYDLCTRKITDEQLSGIDLSTWSLAFNGAEPVRPETLQQFTDRFSKYGFREEAFYPCYGMAETTLFASGGKRNARPTIRCYDGSSLDDGRIKKAAPDGDNARFLVGCGHALGDEEILIVNPDTRTRSPHGKVGEIWLASKSVGKGYWNRADATSETFQATLADDSSESRYLRTGDLGFVDREELFVTGRLKDLIIVRGVNRYPQDIEMTVERADRRLRNGASAAFAMEIDGQERLVIVSEVERGEDDNWKEVIEAIRRDVTMEHELAPEGIVLVRYGSIPKTSSGKIQRHACRNGFQDDTLLVVSRMCMWEESNGRAANTNGYRRTRSDEKQGSVLDVVIQKLREIGKERVPEDIDGNTNIVELGLDSLERMEIINVLEDHFGGRLPEAVLPQIETCQEVATAIIDYIGDEPQQREKRKTEIAAEQYRFDKMPEYVQLKQNMQLLESTGAPNPFFRAHQRVTRDTTRIDDKEFINFSSYNYLGMSGDPVVNEAAREAVDRYGTSVSASRLVSGEKTLHTELEDSIAKFIGTDAALVLVGGHATNETTIGHLCGPGDLILHDALAHNSIIQGAILSGARRRPFPHNDWKTLNELLSEFRHDYRRVLVVIEGVYSMDGDYPQLANFIEVKKRHRAFLMVDEAHSIGTMGPTGKGISEFFDVDPKDVDIWMGTLSKSFGSCGGYISGSNELVEYLKYTAPGFVYSVGLSPPNAAAALASIRLLQQQPERATRCIENAQLFLELARQKKLSTGWSRNTPIVPIITGNSLVALQLSNRLYEQGINVQPILYPAVEESAARLRFFITSVHTEEQIRFTVDTIASELSAILSDNAEASEFVSAGSNRI